MTVDTRRVTYGMQKGGLVAGDLVVFAEKTGISLESAAAFLLLVACVCVGLTLGHLYKARKAKA